MTRRKALWIGAGLATFTVALFAVAPHLPPDAGGEATRIFEALDLHPGAVIADVGSGSGKYAIASAGLTGPNGRVFATELSSEDVGKIKAAAEKAGIGNLEALLSGEAATNLPAGCCDGIYVRRVYHHISKPGEFNVSLTAALKPGGRLAVIDFPPSWWNFFLPQPGGLPADRTGHGIAAEIVERELTAAGLTLERRIESWSSSDYCLVFRKPESQR